MTVLENRPVHHEPHATSAWTCVLLTPVVLVLATVVAVALGSGDAETGLAWFGGFLLACAALSAPTAGVLLGSRARHSGATTGLAAEVVAWAVLVLTVGVLALAVVSWMAVLTAALISALVLVLGLMGEQAP